MSFSAEYPQELFQLLHELRDGQLSTDDSMQLRTMLAESDEALKLYVDHAFLVSRLHWAHGTSTEQEPLKVGTIQRLTTSLRTLRLPHWIALAASLLLIGYFTGIVGMLLWDQQHASQPRRELDDERNLGFAQLVRATDVSWNDASQESTLAGGAKKLAVHSGSAELAFADGARVVIEGPAEFEVRSARLGFLHHGRLLGIVPPQAIGFAIETPMAKVVDLGTEFGVVVEGEGETSVRVLRGQIRVEPKSQEARRAAPAESFLLNAGDARRIEYSAEQRTTVVQKIPATSQAFATQAKGSGVRRINVGGAIASSEIHGCSPQHLVDGSGMHGACHVNDMDVDMPAGSYNMWMGAYGKVHDEYVLFDLSGPCRLDSMKVWNFNDGRYGLQDKRGVKQADIYTSKSGKGNPLSDPQHWRLIEENRSFKPAPGTSDYDTPEVVDLQQTEARFVGIVIDDHFGPDKPGNPADQDCVGLSEVQFFGERVKTSPKPTSN